MALHHFSRLSGFPVKNYEKYVEARNKLNEKMRKAKRAKENEIARLVKKNPKAFFSKCVVKNKNKLDEIEIFQSKIPLM